MEYFPSSSTTKRKTHHAVVIVLGDSGRSPRMQFHAQSLAGLDEIHRVSLIGYSGEECNAAITSNKKIRDCRLDASTFHCIEFLRGYSSLLHAVLKGILLVLALIRLLFFVASRSYTSSHDGKVYPSIPISFIIIQNPPATPVILATYLYRALVYLYAFCTFSSLSAQTFSICIDWHNLGFTLYYDRYNPTHFLVRICYYLEFLMAQLSDSNFCVSSAMRKWLLTNYAINSTVFYDRPPKSVFQKFRADIVKNDDISGDIDGKGADSEVDSCCCVRLADRHNLLQRLDFTDAALFPALLHPQTTDTTSDMTEVTLQTYRHRTTGALHLRPDRAVLLLSSTSWTPDEDFALLTKALINLDKSIAKRRGSESPRKRQPPAPSSSSSSSPSPPQVTNVATRVVVVITGKGPMKEQFMADWNKSQEVGSATRLTYISLKTVWLEIADYPLLVGCADMGICLHTSSSGVDLPMKVLDMFGSAVPVCAVSFPALPELVQNGVNGIIFRTSSELSAHLFRIFCDFPRDLNSLKDLKEMKKKTLEIGCWEENWASIVQPVVLKSLQHEQELSLSTRIVTVLRWSMVALVLALVCGLWGSWGR